MNKRGFTLVELLAIITVLGLLVIIAIPNMREIVNTSKKKTFFGDAQTIYKTANLYSLEITDSNGAVFNSKGENKLDISRSDFDYCIKINNNGDITTFVVSNGKYIIEAGSDFINLNEEAVIEGNMNSYICE